MGVGALFMTANAICNEIPFFPSLSVLSQCVHKATAFCFHPSLSSKNKSVSKVLLTAIIVILLSIPVDQKTGVRENNSEQEKHAKPQSTHQVLFYFILFCLLCRKGIFFFVSPIGWYLKLICVCDRERESAKVKTWPSQLKGPNRQKINQLTEAFELSPWHPFS